MKIINNSGLSLESFIELQIKNLFPNNYDLKIDLKKIIDNSLDKTNFCFNKINNKYYSDKNNTIFNIHHGDQYAQFLYFLSRSSFLELNNLYLSSLIYLLNRTLNSIDVFYEVSLPNIFFFSHPTGTVLGRAKYDDYLIVSQGVTVGGNLEKDYPILKQGVYLGAGSKIIGRSIINKNNLIAVDTKVINLNTPSNSIVYNGEKNKIVTRSINLNIKENYFR